MRRQDGTPGSGGSGLETPSSSDALRPGQLARTGVCALPSQAAPADTACSCCQGRASPSAVISPHGRACSQKSLDPVALTVILSSTQTPSLRPFSYLIKRNKLRFREKPFGFFKGAVAPAFSSPAAVFQLKELSGAACCPRLHRASPSSPERIVGPLSQQAAWHSPPHRVSKLGDTQQVCFQAACRHQLCMFMVYSLPPHPWVPSRH